MDYAKKILKSQTYPDSYCFHDHRISQTYWDFVLRCGGKHRKVQNINKRVTFDLHDQSCQNANLDAYAFEGAKP